MSQKDCLLIHLSILLIKTMFTKFKIPNSMEMYTETVYSPLHPVGPFATF